MIKSYKNAFTANIAARTIRKGFPSNLIRAAQRKLAMLDSAAELNDLRSSPGNILKPLANKGRHRNQEGQHSIRINDKWRICFIWGQNSAEQVEIVDYHGPD